ncbi:MAG: acyl-CoA dehydrogenase [Cognaticolwellia sp.]|jgi:acyl-CoA dehydrogenase
MFIQSGPQVPDLFLVDQPLHAELKRRLPQEVISDLEPQLRALGKDTAGALLELSSAAEASPPVHVPYDAWGRRVDEIQTSAAWKKLKAYAAQKRLVACGYDADLGTHRRVAQAAKLYLFSASSAIYSCPLAMTDAAARVLLDSKEEGLRQRLLPRLLSDDPETFITSGQWMTERPGGSDVGRTETLARPALNGGYTLHGVKWFTSATTSEMALTLARIDDGVSPPVSGSRGLTLFCVDVRRDEHGQLEGIQVNRLKDKLGTRALPTAELTLDGAPATQIGDVGRGVATISTMLNVTRYYNAVSSASNMAKAVWMAHDYAQRRQAFGKVIAEHPLHAQTLAELQAHLHGALSMSLEVAALLGAVENGSATPQQVQVLRALVPLAKLTLGKQVVAVSSEALECFGGAGYVEDTGLPRLLRDAQVLPIWEGTTNVLSLDLLRAEARDGAFSALLLDLSERCVALPEHLELACRSSLSRSLARVGAVAQAHAKTGDRGALERDARRLALTLGRCAQAVFVGETAAQDPASVGRFNLLVRCTLMAPLA